MWRGGLRRVGGRRGGVLLDSVGRRERGSLLKGKERSGERERKGSERMDKWWWACDYRRYGGYTLGKHNMRHDMMSTNL